MKVIKANKWPPEEKVFRFSCPRCQSLLECTKKDIIHDQREGDRVLCPVCEIYIDWDRVKIGIELTTAWNFLKDDI